jgi:hypothetical protein
MLLRILSSFRVRLLPPLTGKKKDLHHVTDVQNYKSGYMIPDLLQKEDEIHYKEVCMRIIAVRLFGNLT